MANYIAFDKLVVGERYWMWSRYWGMASEVEITESGTCSGWAVYIENGEKDDRGFRTDAEWDYFFDTTPTYEDYENARKIGYTPPRVVKGVRYEGNGISAEFGDQLDKLIDNLKKTFDEKEGDEWLIDESSVNYEISDYLITENGRPDNEVIGYLHNRGFEVMPGEMDSFGWLTGIVRRTGVKNKGIVFG